MSPTSLIEEEHKYKLQSDLIEQVSTTWRTSIYSHPVLSLGKTEAQERGR